MTHGTAGKNVVEISATSFEALGPQQVEPWIHPKMSFSQFTKTSEANFIGVIPRQSGNSTEGPVSISIRHGGCKKALCLSENNPVLDPHIPH
jgi:hypothetical protein